MIFLDSDAIMAFLKGKPNMAAFFAAHTKAIFALPIIVLYEVYYGLYFPPLSKRFQKDISFLNLLKKEEERILQLLNDIPVFNVTFPVIKKSADISALLDAKGLKVGKIDVLIAGTILANGYRDLLTNNVTHYENIPSLKIHTF